MQNSPGNSSSRGDVAKLVIVGIILVAMSLVMGKGGLIFSGSCCGSSWRLDSLVPMAQPARGSGI